LAQLDDSPILRIGEVWKAKSPLELLCLYGERITEVELDAFFAIAQKMLETDDPALELEPSERWMASALGKAQPHSQLLADAVCDSLVKLAVYGSDFSRLAAKDVNRRIARLVGDLLDNADETRWLSISHVLPRLSEAAPEAYLGAVERGLVKPNGAITALFHETISTAMFGRCWYAPLLWSLELLAWAPEYLKRVSIILAKLSTIERAGDWGNSPEGSLLDIFRAWFPQTAASVEERLAVAATLTRDHPGQAFTLFDGIVRTGPDSTSSCHRPAWRDFDAGAGHGTTYADHARMVIAASDYMISLASGNGSRLARLVEKLDVFEEPRRVQVFDLIRAFARTASDRDKESVRAAVRHRLHWQLNFNSASDDDVAREHHAYADLTPTYVVERHAWLFRNSWVDLPIREDERNYAEHAERTEAWRQEAIEEIYAAHGWHGVTALAILSSAGHEVGLTAGKKMLNFDEFNDWVTKNFERVNGDDELRRFVRAYFAMLTESDLVACVEASLGLASDAQWSDRQKVRLLVLAPDRLAVWMLADGLGDEAAQMY